MSQTLSANVNNDIPGVSENDIYLDSRGNISISRDLQAVLQECAQVAKTRLGELVFNVDLGIPFFDTVWDGIPNIPQYTAALRSSILNVDGVIEIISLLAAPPTDENKDILNYTAIIRTIYGTGSING